MSPKNKSVNLVIIAAIAGGMFCNCIRNVIEGIAMNATTPTLLSNELFAIAFALLIMAMIMVALEQKRKILVLLVLALIFTCVGGIVSIMQVFL